MQRQQDSLVPIGAAVSGLDDPVKKALQTSPQARHHFTQADQVNLLVGASEADPDRGFMARTMALCSLPRRQPRQPASVQARQRAVQTDYDCRRRQ